MPSWRMSISRYWERTVATYCKYRIPICLGLLNSTLLIAVIFKWVPSGYEEYDFFWLSAQKLTFKTWLYFLGEHILFVIITWVMYSLIPIANRVFFTFFLLSILDGICYVLAYSEVWFYILQFPVSHNTVGALAFGISTLNYAGVTGRFVDFCLAWPSRVVHYLYKKETGEETTNRAKKIHQKN